MKSYAASFAKALLISYVLSAAALLVLAFLLYWFELSDAQQHIGILAIYVFACLCGGLYIGKKVKQRQFLWGMCIGLVYFSVHMGGVVAIEGFQPEQIVPITSLALLCMGSGMMGGLLN